MSPGKRDELAARLFSPPGEQPPEQRSAPLDPPEPDVRPTARKDPYRRTVDLLPARHHKLNERQQELAVQLGVARVPGQYVLEELVTLYLTDETTARKLAARVRARFEEMERRPK
jgi:hypothetical protein